MTIHALRRWEMPPSDLGKLPSLQPQASLWPCGSAASAVVLAHRGHLMGPGDGGLKGFTPCPHTACQTHLGSLLDSQGCRTPQGRCPPDGTVLPPTTTSTRFPQTSGRGPASPRCCRPCARLHQAAVRPSRGPSAAAGAAGDGGPTVSSVPCRAPLPTGPCVPTAPATPLKAKVGGEFVHGQVCVLEGAGVCESV